jgi:DNA-binding ferritin-like protein (Dps family)
LTASDFTKAQIALACWRAARAELHHVMLGVLMVFMNRAVAESKEVYEVATEWLEEFASEFTGYPDERDPQFQQLLAKMDAILAGQVPDKTGGALWFVPKSRLSEDKLQPFTITATIGQMIFCR